MAYLDVPKPVGNYMRYGLTDPDRLIDDSSVDEASQAVESFLEATDALRDLLGRDRTAILLHQAWSAMF
jgi:hypothetical protein